MCVCCKQETAYDMRISDWSSDVCSSDLGRSTPAFAREQHGDTVRRLREPHDMRTTPIAASRFGILVDGVEIATFSALQGVKSDLGSWSKVEGLAVSWDVARYQLERLALASGASRTPPTLTFTRPRSHDMRLWMWHRPAMTQPAGAQRD